jgi:hypothetical protein
MSNRILNSAIAGPAVLAALTLLMLSPALADNVRSTSCVGTRSSTSCVTTWRRGVVDPFVRELAPRSEQEIAESKEREQKWRTRCRPTVQQDRYGVSRYTYAGPGCEFGSYE